MQQKVEELSRLLKMEMSAAGDDLDLDKPNWGRKPGQKGRGS
jgi:hypothetical protein